MKVAVEAFTKLDSVCQNGVGAFVHNWRIF